MCLTRLDKTINNPLGTIQNGFKQFVIYDKLSIHFECCSLGGKKEVPLDTWLTAEEYEVVSGNGIAYKTGFHIYPSAKETEFLHGRRLVYYRNVTAVGMEWGKMCFIAREIYVPSDEKAEPPFPVSRQGQ